MKPRQTISTSDLKILLEAARDSIEVPNTQYHYVRKVQSCISRVERAITARINAKIDKRLKKLPKLR